MNTIQGRAKKHDGTAIDYVSIFNWADGKCIAQVVPNAAGEWLYSYDKNLIVGFNYVADGCEPLAHGPYEFDYVFDGDVYFADVDLLLIADTEQNSYKDWSLNARTVTKQYQVSIQQLEGKPAFRFEGNFPDANNNINGRIITSVAPLGTADYTLEFYGAQTPLTGPGARFFELGTADANRTKIQMKWEEYDGSVEINGTYMTGDITLEPKDSILRHYAIMRKNGVTGFYINGVLQFSSSATFNINQTNLTLGTAWPFNGPLQGYIQQFRVTKLARYAAGGFTPDVEFKK